jgi:hypothetical protein
VIQRFNIDAYWDGLLVLHTDHLSAMAELEGENAKLREEVAALNAKINEAVSGPVKIGLKCCESIATKVGVVDVLRK